MTLDSLLAPLWFRPKPIEPIEPRGEGSLLARGRPFTVISWNIQFSAGRSRFFFYDGGPDSGATETEVRHTLAGITALLQREKPDLVLLQEVDRKSRRTAWIDQHTAIESALGLPCSASTPYFKVPYVPVPPHAPMGPVEMHLSVFSRFSLGPGRRIALCALKEPLWRRAFNLRRALMHMPIAVEEEGTFDLFQTHLSAFSRGDGTLVRQVATVQEEVKRTPLALLAGDFNSLPPGDDPKRLGLAQVLYAEARTPIQPLLDCFTPIFPTPGVPANTYVPWGSEQADRTLDYALGQGPIRVREARALPEGAAWSDHLPIRLVLEIETI